MKEKCMQRLNDNLGHEFKKESEIIVEHQIIHYSHEKQHELIDACLLPYFNNEKTFKFNARLDILSKTTIWEIKCTSQITLEHKLQVVVYAWLWNTLYPESPRKMVLFNIRSNEKMRLECSYKEMTEIVVSLLRNKYSEPSTIDDISFLTMCQEIKNTYIQYSQKDNQDT